MRVHQFNLGFDPEEDRILLRINTVSGDSFRFFLTRRFVRLLWPVLQRLLAADFQRRQPEKAHIRNDILPFERERTLRRTDFSRPFEESAAAFPLGETPVLLTRIQVKPSAAGEILRLHPTRGAGVELPATPTLLHALCRMIRDVVGRAQWDLSLEVPDGGGGASPTADPTTLH